MGWWSEPVSSRVRERTSDGTPKPCGAHVYGHNSWTGRHYCEKCGIDGGPSSPVSKPARSGRWGR